MRTRMWLALVVLLVVLVASSFVYAPAYAVKFDLISQNDAGASGNGPSWMSAISDDGRYVVFISNASNLVEGDTNDQMDLFVRDCQAGTTERVNVSSDEEQSDVGPGYAAISADGRYVAFESAGATLVPGDTNEVEDIFVRDRLNGVTERVSVSTSGDEANAHSFVPSISADGRYVVFESIATNLVVGDTNGSMDIFLRDRVEGTTERISVSSSGAQATSQSYEPSITLDGRYVVFHSFAPDLVAGDTNNHNDVFLRDRDLGLTERISISSAGEEGNSDSSTAAVSADGRFVAFTSYADNLIDDDTNLVDDVFVRDRSLNVTERVSVGAEGQQSDGPSDFNTISADGRMVSFRSRATNLVGGDTNGVADAFVYDRQSQITKRVSVLENLSQSYSEIAYPAISGNGLYVAFQSNTAFSGSVTTATQHVFRCDWQAFPDVPHDHWAFASVIACVDAGIVQGYPNGLYYPEYSVTRDQMAVYISRALAGGDVHVPTGPATATFDDVPTDHWAFKYVEYCYGHGVVAGYDATTYAPDVAVDRGQMAVYVARAVAGGDASVPAGPATATFNDVPTDYWAFKYVEYCKAQGIVQGYDAVTYAPDVEVTRDQMAVYMARAFDLLD